MSNALTRLFHHIACDLLIPETSHRLLSTATLNSLRTLDYAEDDSACSSRPSNSSNIYASAASLFHRLSASRSSQPFVASIPRASETTVNTSSSKDLGNTSGPHINSLRDYIELRQQNRSQVVDLSPEIWSRIIGWATSTAEEVGNGEVINSIAKDLVRSVAHGQSEYQEPIISLLRYAAEGPHGASVSHDQVLELFHALPSSLDLASSLSSTLISRIFQAILDQPYVPLYQSFFQSAFPILLKGKSLVPVPLGESRSRESQNRETGVLLRLLEKVTQTEHPQEAFALKLFSSLSSAKRIPTSVIHHASRSLAVMQEAGMAPTETIRHVMLEVCSLTCFKWGWHSEGFRFLKPLLQAQDIFSKLQKYNGVLASPQSNVIAKDPVNNLVLSLDAHASSLSSPSIRLITKIIHSQLVLSNRTDFNTITALILAYARVAAAHPSIPPLPQDLLNIYWDSLHHFDSSGIISSLVYQQLHVVKEWHAQLSQTPPAHVSKAILDHFIRQGDTVSAEQLIERILLLGETAQGFSESLVPAAAMVEAGLVERAIEVGRPDLAHEIWKRAKNRWKGYPFAPICGDRRVIKALFRSLEVAPMAMADVDFHTSVLATFIRTKPKLARSVSDPDFSVFNWCWRILTSISDVPLPKTLRMRRRRIRSQAIRTRHLMANRRRASPLLHRLNASATAQRHSG